MNEFIRNFTGSDAELYDFNAVCEVCGHKGIYGNMLHEDDVICCNTEGCYTTKGENKMEITGFKHVTEEGIARLYQTLDSYGTLGMLWELDNGEMANMLMNIPHFDYADVIPFDNTSSEYDDMLMEIHDELVDAYVMVQYGYANCIDNQELNGRSITNLSSAVDIEIKEWEHKEISLAELQEHCANTTHEHAVYVRLFAHEDGHSHQRFHWTIGEAEEFNIFATMYDTIKKLYPNVTIQLD
jgi:hypothetical protein